MRPILGFMMFSEAQDFVVAETTVGRSLEVLGIEDKGLE
jgi:hypothetical protein